MKLWHWLTLRRDRQLADRLIEANAAKPRKGMADYDPAPGNRIGKLRRWHDALRDEATETP